MARAGRDGEAEGGEPRWLLLPVELWRREIDTRLLLSLYALRRGRRVLLGYLSDPAFAAAPPGALLYKSHNASVRDYLGRWRARGHVCAALDEEGLIYRSPELYVATRIDAAACDGFARLFAWGAAQAALFPAELRPKLVVSGHPKIDLARLAAPGPARAPGAPLSVLVNTRFPLLTGFVRAEAAPGYLAKERAILETFDAAVRRLAAEPGVAVRLRPHPSEDPAAYAARFADCPAVTIEADRGLIDAVRASDAVVHDSCTTAIEAAAFGAPVFGLRPPGLGDHYDTAANRFSTNLSDPEALLGRLRALRDGRAAPPIRPEGADRLIANLSGPLAVETILDTLAPLTPPGAPAPAAWTLARPARALGAAARGLRDAVRRRRDAVREQKFSAALTEADLRARLATLNDGLRAPQDLSGLRLRKVGRRAFLMSLDPAARPGPR